MQMTELQPQFPTVGGQQVSRAGPKVNQKTKKVSNKKQNQITCYKKAGKLAATGEWADRRTLPESDSENTT